MIKFLSKREKAIFNIAIVIILLALAYNFLIEPLLVKNQDLNAKIKFARLRLNRYKQLLAQKDYLQSEHSKLPKGLTSSKTEEDKLVSLLSGLESLAKDANIRIVEIRPQNTQLESRRKKDIVINLKTEGMMNGYLKFVYLVENSALILNINSFKLNSKPRSTSLEGSFSISQPSL